MLAAMLTMRPRSPGLALLLALLAVALIAAACSSGDGSGDDPHAGEEPPDGAPGGGAEGLDPRMLAAPPAGTARNMDASRGDAGKAYITVDSHQVGNFDPYVYKTDDYGRRWKKIADGISESPLSYVRNIREDPVRPGLLYLGTENALYVSFDDGAHWQTLQLELPVTPITDLRVHEGDLVVATQGRSSWILDDLAPPRPPSHAVASAAASL